MRRTVQYLALGALLCTGCEAHTLSIMLSPGYKGKVLLSCTSFQDDADIQVQIGQNGTTEGTCPKHQSTLRVYQGGKEVSPQDVTWARTDDDIVTSIGFTVR